MRDLAVIGIVIACVALTFYRPWLGVLALTVFGYMHPQSYAAGFMHDFPAYKLLFIAVLAALVISKQWRLPPLDWRLFGLAALWAYFLFTTYHAQGELAAWPRFAQVTQIFL